MLAGGFLPHELQARGKFDFDALREVGKIRELPETEGAFDFRLQNEKANWRKGRLSQLGLGRNGNSVIDAKEIRNSVEQRPRVVESSFGQFLEGVGCGQVARRAGRRVDLTFDCPTG